jgi:hypothetical protein
VLAERPHLEDWPASVTCRSIGAAQIRFTKVRSAQIPAIQIHGTQFVTGAFDLYILKSCDGNNQTYGPDRWSLRVQGGATLLDTTFSNNPKTGDDLSQQNYPVANSPYQSGAASVNTPGYTFYGDSIYHLHFSFPHVGDTLALNFSSSLFEGKGTDDESWGLDNVRVSTNSDAPIALRLRILPSASRRRS